jgi:N-acetylglucosamine malate deacetylase 1
MNVIVIAPHPDDEAIGCGGAICLHTARRDRVHVVFLTSGELGLKQLSREEAWTIREREAEAAAAVLEISALSFLRGPDWTVGDAAHEMAEALRAVLARESPSVIYVPHAEEWHPDHRASLPIVKAALESEADLPVLRNYEVWTPLGAFDRVEDITTVMHRKLRAVRCYTSQLGYYRYDRAVRGLGLYRGAIAGRCRYAEVFSEVGHSATVPSGGNAETGSDA